MHYKPKVSSTIESLLVKFANKLQEKTKFVSDWQLSIQVLKLEPIQTS